MPARANLQTAQQGNLSSPMSTHSKEHWIAATMGLWDPIICLLEETQFLLISFAFITLPLEALWLASGRISTSFEQEPMKGKEHRLWSLNPVVLPPSQVAQASDKLSVTQYTRQKDGNSNAKSKGCCKDDKR